jgi:hypothetical protein
MNTLASIELDASGRCPKVKTNLIEYFYRQLKKITKLVEFILKPNVYIVCA